MALKSNDRCSFKRQKRRRQTDTEEKTWQRLESGLNKPRNGKDLDKSQARIFLQSLQRLTLDFQLLSSITIRE